MKQVYCMLTALVLTSCTTTTTPTPAPIQTHRLLPIPTPASNPYLLSLEVPARGTLSLSLVSGEKPESDPTLTFAGLIIDNLTYQPVTADVYIIASEEDRAPMPNERVLHETEDFEINIRSQLNGWIVVRAPNYADWRLRLHFRIKTSRKLEYLIEMQKLPGEATL